jgi:hypothetical protein
MIKTCYFLFILLLMTGACAKRAAETEVNNSTVPAKVSEADIAKLKWIEGAWRGMDGEKPFFERYRFEGTTLLVIAFEDGSMQNASEPTRFELVDGEFGTRDGNRRSVATSITDNAIQFAPATPGQGNLFRFERQPDGNWNAVLDWPATDDKPARQKVYEMKRWPPAK